MAALTSGLPHMAPQTPVVPEGGVLAGNAAARNVRYLRVSPEFLQTLRIPLRRGRGFLETDAAGAPQVAIISQSAAARFWPGQDPIGRRFAVGRDGTPVVVVGVSAETPVLRTSMTTMGFVYVPIDQHYSPQVSVLVRTAEPAAMVDHLRQALQAVDTDLALFDSGTVAEAVGLFLAPIRITAIVVGSLAVLGFGIAMLGVYGVMTYTVSHRTREFGVHKALGATEAQIQTMVLGQGLRMLLFGVLPGLLAAFIGAGFLRNLLFRVQPYDPVIFVGVPTGLVLAGLLACYFPARRAGRVEPSVALRDL